MSIVRRTVVMVIGITLVLFVVLFFLSDFIYARGFGDLEKKVTERNATRVTDAMNVQLNAVNTFCQDWSSWDDTYQFARLHDDAYVTRNLMDATFTSADISLFVVMDTTGDIIYGKAYDLMLGQSAALPADLTAALAAEGLTQPLGQQAFVSGIMVFAGMPTLVAARPILTSLDEGPSAGNLIIGRYLDAGVITALGVTTSLSVSVINLPVDASNSLLAQVMAGLDEPGNFYFKALDKDTMNGYKMVADISGHPAFIFRVAMSRDIYAQGQRTIAYLQIMLLGVGVIFAVVYIVMTRRLILSRLMALSRAVADIGKRGDMSSRVDVSGNDELSRLGGSINHMLESLEKSEELQRSQREILRHVMANTPVAFFVFDSDDRFILFNEAFRRMFNIAQTHLDNVKITELPALAWLMPEIRSFKAGGNPSLTRELQFASSGAARAIMVSFASLKEDRYFLSLTDISEERARQESLYLTDRLASIGEMASGIAHELNNPLTSIIGLSELVTMEDVPETVKEDMSMIKSESQRAADIVKNLLSFARRNTSMKQPTAVNKLLLDILRLRSYEHGVGNITVNKEFDPDLPDIMADSAQIQQVFINVILNAEQAMASAHARGTLTIKTERRGDLVRVTFTDDGPGIPPENLRRIFNPFFTTKEVGKGTGLGLSISYGIVKAHGGQISASSQPGGGATFIVELPIHGGETGTNAPDGSNE